eukprot:tig00020685_g12938.t1
MHLEKYLNDIKKFEVLQQRSRPDKANELGTQFYKAGKYEQAISAYSNAINAREWSSASATERATILANRSAAYLRGGRLEDAEADARASLKLRPGNAKGTLYTCRIRSCATVAIVIRPRASSPQATGSFKHAKTLFALGRFAEAAEACSSAAAADPSAPAYSRGREAALRAAEAADSARKLREEGNRLFSPELNARDVAARANLAAALLSLGRLEECADLALAAPCQTSLVPRDRHAVAAKLFLRAGMALAELGRPVDAAASLRLALDFAPGARPGRAPGDGRWEGGGAGLDACTARVPQPASGGARLSNHVSFENHYLQAAAAGGGAPVSALFVGVGDVRNVLRTAQEAAGPGAPRLAFSLCDIDRCVLARDVLLLAAASEMGRPAPEDLRFLWRAWFCLEMPPGERRRLNATLAALAGAAASPEAWAASPFGAWLRVPCPGDLALLREVWEYWLSPAVPPLARVRVQRHSHAQRIAQLHESARSRLKGWKPAELRTHDPRLGSRRAECERRVQLLAPAFNDVEREMADWFRTWSAAPDDAPATAPGGERPERALNPTLVAPPRGLCLTHYRLHPFGAFAPEDLAAFSDAAAPPRALALVPAPAPGEHRRPLPPPSRRRTPRRRAGEGDGLEEPPPRALCRATLRLLAQMVVPFAEAVAEGRLSVAAYAADGIQLCWDGASGGGAGALPADERFDFIDGSNLADNEGLWPLLAACGWRLKEADHAALATTSMKWSNAHSDPREYLLEELGFPAELAPTLLGLRLATDVDAMLKFARPPPALAVEQCNSALEVVLTWKRPTLRGPPTALRVAEGDPVHQALSELADRAAHHAGSLGGGKRRAKQPSHSTLYLFAATVADLVGRVSNPAELLRMADALVAARAVGSGLPAGYPARPSLAAQWRVARALAGLDGAGGEEGLVYVQLAPAPVPLPPALATGFMASLLGPGASAVPCPMVRLLVATGGGGLADGGTHAAFDLLDFDHWTGTVGLLVPAELHAAAAAADAQVVFTAAETGEGIAASPLRYSELRALPGGPPVPRSALAARPPPEPALEAPGVDLRETEGGYRAAVDFGGAARGPVTASIQDRHLVLFRSQDGRSVTAACLHPLEAEPELEASCAACGATAAPGASLRACARCRPLPLARARPPRLTAARQLPGGVLLRAGLPAGALERGSQGAVRGPAPPGSARAVFLLPKGPAHDAARVDVCALPAWTDVESIGTHMSQMHSAPGFMTRMAELNRATTGDPLRDLKESLTILFVKFIRDGVRHHGLQRESGASDIVFYIKSAHRTRAGAPVLLVGYADVKEKMDPVKILQLAQGAVDPVTKQLMIHGIRATKEEFRLFRRLLADNARLLDPACCRVRLNGVDMRPSFLVPLYHRAALEELHSDLHQLAEELKQRPDLKAVLRGDGDW